MTLELKKIKYVTVSTFSPSSSYEVMGLDFWLFYTFHGILKARILEWVAYLGELSNPGIESALQVDSLPAELPRKPWIASRSN